MTTKDDISRSIAEQSLKRYPEGAGIPTEANNRCVLRTLRSAASKFAG
jgi:hypothetical protein